jgi:hypothetical protein
MKRMDLLPPEFTSGFREPGYLGKKIFILPAVMYLVFVALVVGSWWLGHRTGWDMDAIVGTGRSRGPAGYAITMSCSLAVMSLIYAVYCTLRAVRIYRIHNAKR